MEAFVELFNKFVGALAKVLPISPIAKYLPAWKSIEWLGWLNWLFPIKQCLQIFAAYLACIAVFYLYSIVLRWVRAIS